MRSILPRAGVAAGYLALGTAMLAVESHVARDRGADPSHRFPAYLIVTNETFSPAFDALAGWVRSEGGQAVVLTMEGLTPAPMRLAPPGWEIAYLSGVSFRYGYPTVIVGGEESVLGVEPRFMSGAIGRAPVGSLDEAWAFVDLCRRRGLPLDPLVFNPGADPLVADRAPVTGLLVVPAVARRAPARP